MGVASHDLSVLACAWLGFVGVDDEIGGSFGGGDFGHEGVFEAGGEAGAAAAAYLTKAHGRALNRKNAKKFF